MTEIRSDDEAAPTKTRRMFPPGAFFSKQLVHFWQSFAAVPLRPGRLSGRNA
jgi:hypothetical protein